MMWPDIINGSLEFAGGLFILTSVRKLLQDKTVKGVHWSHASFFWAWGLWNLFYYPHLDQWLSFAGGVFIVLANMIWLALMIRYWPRGD